MSLSHIIREARAIGITIVKTEDEYQVYPKGQTNRKYYTDCPRDALNTAKRMHADIKGMELLRTL